MPPHPSVVSDLPDGTIVTGAYGSLTVRFGTNMEEQINLQKNPFKEVNATSLDYVDEFVVRLGGELEELEVARLRFWLHAIVEDASGEATTYEVTANGSPVGFSYILLVPASQVGTGFSYLMGLIGESTFRNPTTSSGELGDDWFTDDVGNAGLFSSGGIDALAFVLYASGKSRTHSDNQEFCMRRAVFLIIVIAAFVGLNGCDLLRSHPILLVEDVSVTVFNVTQEYFECAIDVNVATPTTELVRNARVLYYIDGPDESTTDLSLGRAYLSNGQTRQGNFPADAVSGETYTYFVSGGVGWLTGAYTGEIAVGIDGEDLVMDRKMVSFSVTVP